MAKNEFDNKVDRVFYHEYIDGQGHIVAPKNQGWKFLNELYDIIEKQAEKIEDALVSVDDYQDRWMQVQEKLAHYEEDIKHVRNVWRKEEQVVTDKLIDCQSKLAHYEDNVVARFEGEYDAKHSVLQLSKDRCDIIDMPLGETEYNDGKQYKVIVMEM